MVQKLIRYSDISDTQGAAEHQIGIDGAGCSIDLTDDEFADLVALLRPYFDAGRTSGRRVPGLRETGSSSSSGSASGARPSAAQARGLTRAQRDDVRAYAERQGMAVRAGGGPLPAAQIDAWEAAGRPGRNGTGPALESVG